MSHPDKLASGAGTRLGRYVLLVPIGVGGMGQVWIGEHAAEHAFRRLVAVKLIRGEHVRDADYRRMFLAEARVTARVAHANVVEVIDLGEDANVLYQVMEYVEGDSLAQLLARANARDGAPPPVAVVARIVVDALRGLHAAHEATDADGKRLGLIHRDVSPHNVLVGIDGIARIADFGIAKVLADRAAETEIGQVKGKRGYMSPEQATGARLDRTSDLYSMGVVAWEGLTGKRLHPSGARDARVPVPAIADGATDPRVSSFIAKALSVSPDDRFSSAEEMADAVESTGLCATQRDVATWVKALSGDAIEARRAEVRSVTRELTVPAASVAETKPESIRPTDAHSVHAHTLADAPAALPAPAARTGSLLAVLPFRYRGPPTDAYLAEAFSEELVDVLSRTASLRVLSMGAVARFAEDRDPSSVRRALGSEVIVDATLQRAGTQVRVGVRLVDAISGVQLWSEQFTGTIAESFELQETMSRRIAEELRVELAVRSTGGVVPAEAVELCLRARARLRQYHLLGPDGAKGLLEQSLALAPSFAPAVAALAIANVRAWFLPKTERHSTLREVDAKKAVALALREAPGLAETHFAAGILALNLGDLQETIVRLNRALTIAPHYPDALSTLGALECETGRPERGKARLELALQLSPDVTTAYALAFEHALHGRYATFEEILSHPGLPRDGTGLLVLQIRVAAWQNDLARVAQLAERLRLATRGESAFEPYAAMLLGRISLDEGDELLTRFASELSNTRLRTVMYELGAEAFAMRGERARAERYLKAAADGPLHDLNWLEHCPALEALRGTAVFEAARASIAVRIKPFQDN